MAGAVIVLLAGCGPASSPTATASPTATPATAADVFVAQHDGGAGIFGLGGTRLSLFDEATGKFLRDVEAAPGPVNMLRAHFAGYSRSRDGFVYALVHGPSDKRNTEQHSCGGTVLDHDVATGRTRPLFSVGDDVNLTCPVESPDGTQLAYQLGPCSQSAAEISGPAGRSRVVVRDLATGRERKISVPGTSARSPQWRPDGQALVFLVGPNYAVGFNGSKQATYGPSGFLVVPATARGAQPAVAVQYSPDRACGIDQAVFTGSAVQLLLDCRAEDPLLKKAHAEGIGGQPSSYPERLLQLVGSGPRVAWTADTGLCPVFIRAGHDAAGRLLVTGENCGADVPANRGNNNPVQIWAGREVARFDRCGGDPGVFGAT
ncbi:MAG TPA: hypothetical protein VHU88_13820 [Sporichthyaceae bacterium]|nr:hypothetical protein [Sporichthyaceae bacterium]